MNAITPTTPENCRAMAVECGRRANALRLSGDAAGAMKQLDRSRDLCLLALKLEQEQNLPGPHLSVGSNGDPSTPSLEAGGAKMDEVQAHPDRAAPADSKYANSGRAVTHSNEVAA
jgi:hypothetical protein